MQQDLQASAGNSNLVLEHLLRRQMLALLLPRKHQLDFLHHVLMVMPSSTCCSCASRGVTGQWQPRLYGTGGAKVILNAVNTFRSAMAFGIIFASSASGVLG